MSNDKSWLVRFVPRQTPTFRLFCFSYAGGGAAIYRPWALALPPTVDVAAIVLPGRESRLREPPLSRMHDLLAVLTPVLEQQTDIPYAFFGHSMGALVAFEVARALARLGAPMPRRLLLSGRRAPHLAGRESPLHHLDDSAFVAAIQSRYGGIPAEVQEHRELLDLLLPALRADMTLIETHGRDSSSAPIVKVTGSISVFGGLDDPFATRADLEAWQLYSEERLVLRQFAGGHFYFNVASERNALIAAVAADLRSDWGD